MYNAGIESESDTADMHSIDTFAKDKILELLGAGIANAQVAAAVGCDESYISHLISDPEFAKEVASKRFESLSKHNRHDEKLDELEGVVVDRLKQSLSMMVRPGELLGALRIINAAQRRGSKTPATTNAPSVIIQLQLPTVITQQFTQNSKGQVISAGDQDLVTIPAMRLNGMVPKNESAEPEDEFSEREVSNETSRYAIESPG